MLVIRRLHRCSNGRSTKFVATSTIETPSMLWSGAASRSGPITSVAIGRKLLTHGPAPLSSTPNLRNQNSKGPRRSSDAAAGQMLDIFSPSTRVFR